MSVSYLFSRVKSIVPKDSLVSVKEEMRNYDGVDETIFSCFIHYPNPQGGIEFSIIDVPEKEMMDKLKEFYTGVMQ